MQKWKRFRRNIKLREKLQEAVTKCRNRYPRKKMRPIYSNSGSPSGRLRRATSQPPTRQDEITGGAIWTNEGNGARTRIKIRGGSAAARLLRHAGCIIVWSRSGCVNRALRRQL